MDRVAVKAEFGFAFSSNVRFEVMSTIHTYGLAPGAGELTPPAAPSPAP
jgi:hypothetical protein